MKVAFVGQPFDDEPNLYDFVHGALADASIGELAVVVAWAKRSGLRRIAHHLGDFRKRGGKSLIIVGIDEGGATKQGLKLCIDLFDDAYVFHDRSGGTFHPKVHLARGDASARLFLGSNNLTAGGLYFNYEAALDLTLDLAIKEDTALVDSIDRYVNRLIAAKGVCLPLDDAMLATLDANTKINLKDEDESRSTKEGPEDLDQSPHDDLDESVPSPFGKPQFAKRKDPRPQPRPKGKGGQRKPAPPRTTTTPPTTTPPSRSGASGAAGVLIAEIGGGDRWKQANFHKDIYEGFFGAKVGTRRTVRFRHVRTDGSLGPVEDRPSVEVQSQNYRFELDAASGKPYPPRSSGRPIGVFLQVATRRFVYRLVMPSDRNYAELDKFLQANWSGPARFLRQFPSTVAQVAGLKTVQDLIAAAPKAFASP